ncbi:protein of unknown function [Streptomyces sp. KY70]|nr:protein of unknown function [Streptomyces sp. KY70]
MDRLLSRECRGGSGARFRRDHRQLHAHGQAGGSRGGVHHLRSPHRGERRSRRGLPAVRGRPGDGCVADRLRCDQLRGAPLPPGRTAGDHRHHRPRPGSPAGRGLPGPLLRRTGRGRPCGARGGERRGGALRAPAGQSGDHGHRAPSGSRRVPAGHAGAARVPPGRHGRGRPGRGERGGRPRPCLPGGHVGPSGGDAGGQPLVHRRHARRAPEGRGTGPAGPGTHHSVLAVRPRGTGPGTGRTGSARGSRGRCRPRDRRLPPGTQDRRDRLSGPRLGSGPPYFGCTPIPLGQEPTSRRSEPTLTHGPRAFPDAHGGCSALMYIAGAIGGGGTAEIWGWCTDVRRALDPDAR